MRREAALALIAVLALTGCAQPAPVESSGPPAAVVTPTPTGTPFSISGTIASIREAATVDEAVAVVLSMDPEKFSAGSDVMDASKALYEVVEAHMSAADAQPFLLELIGVADAASKDMSVDGARAALAHLQDVAGRIGEAQ